MPRPPVMAIIGPTASGKTALSIAVATRLGAEVISMDSRQVYRGMDIGTAKVTPAQRAMVPHHGLDLVEPHERFSAGRFARFAREQIDELAARGKAAVLVGGTGFFLRSLTHPIFREPDLVPDRRSALAQYLHGMDEAGLHRWLAVLDPPTASRLSGWGGRQRLLRALELPLLTGRPLSWWHEHAPPEAPPLELDIFVLDKPRSLLDEAIDRRVALMVEEGLLDEVAGLLRSGYDESAPGMNATGYIELIPHLRGEISLEEALNKIRANTRAYSRRQLTWLRNQLPEGAIWLDARRPVAELATEIVRVVGEGKGEQALVESAGDVDPKTQEPGSDEE